jgi:hypothetical protein
MRQLMTRTDHKIIFTALGFLAVILDNVPRDKQALRATGLAQLIEAFCATSVPDAFTSEDAGGARTAETEALLELFIAELRDTGSAPLSHDRQTLLGMYELLLIQRTRFEQKDFYASGHEEVIANLILQLAEERLQREGSA